MQAGCEGLLAIEKDRFAFDTLKGKPYRAEVQIQLRMAEMATKGTNLN